MAKNLPKLPFGSMPFSVTVDYNQSKEQMLVDTGFSPTANAWEAPISGQGKVTKLLYLVPFFKPDFYAKEAKALLEKLGLKHAKAEDVLALLRDHREKLKSRKVTSAIAFGTVWGDFVMGFEDGRVGGGHTSNTWRGGDWYLLAVAEDGIRRKVHKTPRIDLPYPQPKPWFKLPKVKAKTNGKAREQAKAKILEKVPRALFFEIEVDYSQTAAEMVEASGFGYEKNPDSTPVTMGRKHGAPVKVKKEIVLIPLFHLETVHSDVEEDKINSFLTELGLSHAFAEDLLAFLRDNGKKLEEHGINRRLMALGTRWQNGNGILDCLRLSFSGLFSSLTGTIFGRSHWILAHFN